MARQIRQNGFTIVEILLVIAISGVIMALVFAAIPTLQRNARNNQRKQDVAAMLQAISKHELNNSGNYPDSTSNFLQYTNFTYYEKNIVYDSAVSEGIIVHTTDIADSTTSYGPNLNLATVELRKYQRCDPANLGRSIGAGAGYYDTVALYAIELGGGNVGGKCQKL